MHIYSLIDFPLFHYQIQNIHYTGNRIGEVSVDIPQIARGDGETEFARNAAFKFFEKVMYTFTEKTGIPTSYLHDLEQNKIVENDIQLSTTNAIDKNQFVKTVRFTKNVVPTNVVANPTVTTNVVTPQFKKKVISYSSDDEDSYNGSEAIRNQAIACNLASITKEERVPSDDKNASSSETIGEVGNNDSLDDVDENGVTKRNRDFIVKSRGSFIRNRHLFY